MWWWFRHKEIAKEPLPFCCNHLLWQNFFCMQGTAALGLPSFWSPHNCAIVASWRLLHSEAVHGSLRDTADKTLWSNQGSDTEIYVQLQEALRNSHKTDTTQVLRKKVKLRYWQDTNLKVSLLAFNPSSQNFFGLSPLLKAIKSWLVEHHLFYTIKIDQPSSGRTFDLRKNNWKV